MKSGVVTAGSILMADGKYVNINDCEEPSLPSGFYLPSKERSAIVSGFAAGLPGGIMIAGKKRKCFCKVEGRFGCVGVVGSGMSIFKTAKGWFVLGLYDEKNADEGKAEVLKIGEHMSRAGY